MAVGGKPVKPKGSPLYPHASGQWAKTIRGKKYYFGSWADGHEHALANYHAVAADLHAGRAPRIAIDAITVGELFDAFMLEKEDRAARGEMSEKTIVSYDDILAPVIGEPGSTAGWLPRDLIAEDLTQDDFQRLLDRAATRWGPTRRGNLVALVKAAFRWGYEKGLLEHTPRFGPDFRKPAKKLQRKVRQAKAPQLFQPEILRDLVNAAPPDLTAWMLLGINCAYGNTDVSELPRDKIDLDQGIIDWPRPKTGIRRTCTLWPETVRALRAVLDDQAEPQEEDAADKAFRSRNGLRLVRPFDNTDVVGQRFIRHRNAHAKQAAGLGFYALRHTFETVADDVRDPHAASRIMGHTLPGMKDVYNEQIDRRRLKHVTDHVRNWLFEMRLFV